GPILYYIYTHPSENLFPALFNLSKRLISDEHRMDEDLRRLRFPSQAGWAQMDLMKIMGFDARGVGLKQTAINLRWHRIQDLPLPYDHHVRPEDVDLILDYNLNDVQITLALYKAIQPQINLRLELGKLYDVNLTSASDSKMANILLEKIYAREMGIDPGRLRNLRTKRPAVNLSDCIAANIDFQTDPLRRLKNDLAGMVVTSQTGYAYQRTVYIDNTGYDLGTGGLHSRDEPAKFETSDQFLIRDADVASYYPSIMIKNKIKPAHLDDNFIQILQKITQERMDAKRSGDKVKADGLKITINSIFGKLGSDAFWLEDAKAMLSVTVSGQLYLLMLIEALALQGIEVISANTDGIVARIPAHLNQTYQQICAWWQNKTGFELEQTDYALYVRSDVNNYITRKADGKTKEKGRYIKDIDLKKGYRYPIVPRCLYEYFINGKSVDQTLSETRDILDFCISQKSGRDFTLEYRTVKESIKLQKTNRFYISRRGGVLVKKNTANKSETGLYVGYHAQLLNDLNVSLPFEGYDIDLGFYKKEALKLINEIEPAINQTSIFDFLPNA
ncbi:MAG: hypothetical protein LWX83_12105, partial [Anaerolineae bacterium]|nr:hypothetical protein [Anaerolineae bacterium]